MTDLELLAPAKNKDIGIAAIDCGADAVYIAGPSFGARQAAGNSMEDLAELCRYAHRFGARVFMTLNTILYDSELDEAYSLMCQAEDAGIDALIVQDFAVLRMADGGPTGGGRRISIPLHASTQCAIRDAEKALFHKRLGFSRLVLERELPLETIRDISSATGCEIEFFVHGALCVCYSGQCYMSEYITGRSANRGECIQACRSLYDLKDSGGRTLVRNKALLSLKDYELIGRLKDLAAAGVTSFKIEGRLKNISYVRNTVKAYSEALDALVAMNPDRYRRASFGKVSGGFVPDLDKTFNRGYTELFLDGRRGQWSSMDTPKGMGERLGKVMSIKPLGRDEMEIFIESRGGRQVALENGDGFAFTAGDGSITGFRGDVCRPGLIRCRRVQGLKPGLILYRNISAAFEKKLASSPCRRMIRVNADVSVSGDSASGYRICTNAVSEDGRKVCVNADAGNTPADNAERMLSMISGQMGKTSGGYEFIPSVSVETTDGSLPFLSAASLNGIRRGLAERLDEESALSRPMMNLRSLGAESVEDKDAASFPPASLDYKFNVANRIARSVYAEYGAKDVALAYEIGHQDDVELMRTKYCIRYELGLCPKHKMRNGADESAHSITSGIAHGSQPARSIDLSRMASALKYPLLLENNGKTFALHFDCERCEMTVKRR